MMNNNDKDKSDDKTDETPTKSNETKSIIAAKQQSTTQQKPVSQPASASQGPPSTSDWVSEKARALPHRRNPRASKPLLVESITTAKSGCSPSSSSVVDCQAEEPPGPITTSFVSSSFVSFPSKRIDPPSSTDFSSPNDQNSKRDPSSSLEVKNSSADTSTALIAEEPPHSITTQSSPSSSTKKQQSYPPSCSSSAKDEKIKLFTSGNRNRDDTVNLMPSSPLADPPKTSTTTPTPRTITCAPPANVAEEPPEPATTQFPQKISTTTPRTITSPPPASGAEEPPEPEPVTTQSSLEVQSTPQHSSHQLTSTNNETIRKFTSSNRNRDVSNQGESQYSPFQPPTPPPPPVPANDDDDDQEEESTSEAPNENSAVSFSTLPQDSPQQEQQQQEDPSFIHTTSDNLVVATLVDEEDEDEAPLAEVSNSTVTRRSSDGGEYAAFADDTMSTFIHSSGTSMRDTVLLEGQRWESAVMSRQRKQQRRNRRRQYRVVVIGILSLVIVLPTIAVVVWGVVEISRNDTTAANNNIANSSAKNNNTNETPTSTSAPSIAETPSPSPGIQSDDSTTLPPIVTPEVGNDVNDSSPPPSVSPVNEEIKIVSEIKKLLIEANATVFGGAEFENYQSSDVESTYWVQALRFVAGTSRQPANNQRMPTWRLKQRYALACIYFATNGIATPYVPQDFYVDNSDNRKKVLGWKNPWLESTRSIYNECLWQGVTCDGSDFVSKLNLKDNRLTGHFPIETVLFRDTLTELQLRDNFVYNDGIPSSSLWNYGDALPSTTAAVQEILRTGLWSNVTWLGHLSKLEILDLYNTRFAYDQGVPTHFANLHQLRYLSISHNLFSGKSASAGSIFTADNMPRLESLYLNELSNLEVNPLPTSLSSMTNLEHVHARNSQFSGNFLTFFGNITSNERNILFPSLRQLVLSNNPQIVGSIPTMIGSITTLESLDLRECGLTGPIPGTALAQLSELTYLGLRGNSFTTNRADALIDLGHAFTKMPRLKNLYLHDTNLTGNLQDLFPDLNETNYFALQDLYLYDNPFLQGTIPNTMGVKMPSLTKLYLHKCQIQGTIPSELGLLSTQLNQLFLYSNRLNGTIPTELGYLNQLQRLALHGNNLTGTMPESICAIRDQGLDYLTADCSSSCTNSETSNETGSVNGVKCSCCTHCARCNKQE